MNVKYSEIWRDDDGYYVIPDQDNHRPSHHEQWLRPYFPDMKGLVVADIGAHVGSHTIWMSKLAASVHAFEPHPIHRQYLSWNVALNNLRNVSIYPFALYDGDGSASMGDVGGGTPLGSAGPHTVNFVALDTITTGWSKLDFMKIDCEGSEAHILRGARQTLLELRPRMIIESHHVYMTGEARSQLLEEIETELNECGYKWTVLTVNEYPNAYYMNCTPM